MSANINVSVIVPIYNCEATLRECLDSLLRQTLESIEIICIDDGSTDASAQIIDEYRSEHDRIVALHCQNGGAGSARNVGLAIARGEYLSFLDADDIFKPNMLERAYIEAKGDDLDIIVFRSDLFFPESDRYESCAWTMHEDLLPDAYPFAGTDIEKDAFKLFVGWAWDKLFRTSFIRENHLAFQEIRTSNDMRFVFSALAKAQRIGFLHDVLIHHRKEEGSLSATREKSWGCFYEALTSLRQQLKDWQLYEHFERDLINYAVHASLWNLHTLKASTKRLLQTQIKDGWAQDLGITDHDEAYFYNKKEYRELTRLCKL